MEELDLLALRFPSRVPVRFHVLEPEGSRVSGGPWSAQGLDVSRTGVRLEASDLPALLLKRLGDWEANLRMEVSFEGIDLPVVGVCRWLKDFGAARWILGVEYVPADKSRGASIASHFERRYLRPKAVRMASYFGGAFVLFAAILVYTAWQRQQVAVARAQAELASAIEQKESLAILISELESRLAGASTDGASPELAREIVALRTELEEARGEIGKKSVALADANRRPQAASRARPAVERGNRFFSDGNLAGARAEYEKARELDPGLAEPNLKLGIVYEFQDRPVDARAAYARYLELRRVSPDRVEIEGRIARLDRQLAAPVPALAAAALPASAVSTPQAAPAKTPSPEDLMAARAKELLEEGHAHLKAKNTGDAVKAYQAVVKDFGGFADGHYWLATALAFEGEDGSACKEFKRYLEIAPSGPLAESAQRNVAECD